MQSFIWLLSVFEAVAITECKMDSLLCSHGNYDNHKNVRVLIENQDYAEGSGEKRIKSHKYLKWGKKKNSLPYLGIFYWNEC